MTLTDRLRYLRIALVATGLICLALYPLMIVWPSGWTWHVGHSDYPLMIVGIYATLGVFLILASRNPLANLSLICFAVWSSVVHGGIMTVHALVRAVRFSARAWCAQHRSATPAAWSSPGWGVFYGLAGLKHGDR